MPLKARKDHTPFAAFLLGINIGPHKRVNMSELKTMCEKMGFKNVRTLLASGNVVFESKPESPSLLSQQLEAQLKKTFGFEVGVIVVTMDDIRTMVVGNPFKKIQITSETRLYVTFCAEEPKAQISVPYKVSDDGGDFRIIHISNNVVYSVLTLCKTGTTNAMNILTKLFGKKITTRNWNTINKLAR